MTEYVEKQEDWMAPNGWGQRAFGSGGAVSDGLFPAAGCPGGLLCTYGLECLGECRGTWVQMDVIEDVSPSRENVLFLAERFNTWACPPSIFGMRCWTASMDNRGNRQTTAYASERSLGERPFFFCRKRPEQTGPSSPPSDLF